MHVKCPISNEVRRLHSACRVGESGTFMQVNELFEWETAVPSHRLHGRKGRHHADQCEAAGGETSVVAAA